MGGKITGRAFVAGSSVAQQPTKKPRRKNSKEMRQEWDNAIGNMRIEVGRVNWVNEDFSQTELLTVIAYIPAITPALNELIRMNHWRRTALTNAWRKIARFLKLAAHGWAVRHKKTLSFPTAGIRLKMERYAPGVAPDPIDNLPAVWKPVLDGLVTVGFSDDDARGSYVVDGVKCAPPTKQDGSRMILFIGLPASAVTTKD